MYGQSSCMLLYVATQKDHQGHSCCKPGKSVQLPLPALTPSEDTQNPAFKNVSLNSQNRIYSLLELLTFVFYFHRNASLNYLIAPFLQRPNLHESPSATPPSDIQQPLIHPIRRILNVFAYTLCCALCNH